MKTFAFLFLLTFGIARVSVNAQDVKWGKQYSDDYCKPNSCIGEDDKYYFFLGYQIDNSFGTPPGGNRIYFLSLIEKKTANEIARTKLKVNIPYELTPIRGYFNTMCHAGLFGDSILLFFSFDMAGLLSDNRSVLLCQAFDKNGKEAPSMKKIFDEKDARFIGSPFAFSSSEDKKKLLISYFSSPKRKEPLKIKYCLYDLNLAVLDTGSVKYSTKKEFRFQQQVLGNDNTVYILANTENANSRKNEDGFSLFRLTGGQANTIEEYPLITSKFVYPDKVWMTMDKERNELYVSGVFSNKDNRDINGTVWGTFQKNRDSILVEAHPFDASQITLIRNKMSTENDDIGDHYVPVEFGPVESGHFILLLQSIVPGNMPGNCDILVLTLNPTGNIESLVKIPKKSPEYYSFLNGNNIVFVYWNSIDNFDKDMQRTLKGKKAVFYLNQIDINGKQKGQIIDVPSEDDFTIVTNSIYLDAKGNLLLPAGVEKNIFKFKMRFGLLSLTKKIIED